MLLLLLAATLLGYKNINRSGMFCRSIENSYVSLVQLLIVSVLFHIPTSQTIVAYLLLCLIKHILVGRSDLNLVYPAIFSIMWLLLRGYAGIVDSIISVEIVSLTMTVLTVIYSLKARPDHKSINNMANLLTFGLLAYVMLVVSVCFVYSGIIVGSGNNHTLPTRVLLSTYFLVKFGFVGFSVTKESAYSNLPIAVIWLLTAIGILIIPALIYPILQAAGISSEMVVGISIIHVLGLWSLLQIKSKRQLVLYTSPNTNVNSSLLVVL